MTLITPEQFAATDAAKTCGVLEEPTPATERQSFHGFLTCIPVDRCNQIGSKTMFAMQQSFSFMT
jgi:hypothetical protein